MTDRRSKMEDRIYTIEDRTQKIEDVRQKMEDRRQKIDSRRQRITERAYKVEDRRGQMEDRKWKIHRARGLGNRESRVNLNRNSFRFVSFVCACVRADWLSSGIRNPKWPPLFSFFRLVRRAFHPPQPPNLLSNFSWVYRSVYIYIYMCIYRRLGGESIWELFSFRFVRASVCAVWLPSRIGD